MSTRSATLVTLVPWLPWLLLGAACAADAGPEPAASVRRVPLAEGAEPTLRFGADWSVQLEGDLRVGDTLHVVYDPARLPDCRGKKYGQPAWAISGYWRIDGGETRSFLVAPERLGSETADPRIELDRAGELELWFHNTSVWGCSEWDSGFGDNFRFEVGEAAAGPAWMGGGVSAVSRWTCDGAEPCPGDLVPLEDGFLYDTWARQRATVAKLYFRVWEPGVTDWDDPELWEKLDVRVHYRYRPGGPTAWRWVTFDRRVGNDARYAVDLRRELDPLGGRTRTSPEDCPDVPLRVTADGFYVETEVEYFFSVNGAELRPAAGGWLEGRFQDYVGLYEPCDLR